MIQDVQTIGQHCISVRLRMLNRVITGIYDAALRPHGLTAAQLNIMTVLQLMEEAHPGEVCELLHLDKSTMSRNMDRMVQKGWLKVGRGRDGRTRLLKVTPKGRRLVEKAIPAWKKAQDHAREILGSQTEEALRHTTDQIWKETEPAS